MSAFGYAVERKGEIVVATVSPTIRAAKVNGLVVLFDFPVFNRNTTEEINLAWAAIEARHAEDGVRIVRVQIFSVIE